jgi:hypothetical protein
MYNTLHKRIPISEAVNRRTHNKITKWNKDHRTNNDLGKHRKLKIEQHESNNDLGNITQKAKDRATWIKQWSRKYYTENSRSSNMNQTMI